MDKYVTREEFELKVQTLNEQYELTRKLLNKQAIAISGKLENLEQILDRFMNRKPDPAIIREAWIRQLPKIREDLHLLELQVARLLSIKHPVG